MRQSTSGTPRDPLDEAPEQGLAPSQVPGDPETSEFHLWKVLFDQTPEAVAVLSLDDRVVRINKEFTRLFGYEPDEVLDRQINDLIVPESLAQSSNALTRLLQEGCRVEAETVRRRKDGSEVYVSLLAVPVTTASGKQLVNYAIYRDISERKKAEAQLLESEARFQAMADKAPVMIWTTGTDGYCNYFSKPWLDFTGRTMEQEVGLGWTQGVHPDDLQICHDEYWPVFHERKPFRMEYRLRRADGEYRWVVESGVPRYTGSGEFAGYIGSNIDITDRKRAESLLAGEKRILEMLARGDSLAEILDGLCRLVEKEVNGVMASILLIEDNRLRHGGAPSLPKAYMDAIDGVVIGEVGGSCGTAAYRSEQVIVEDIAIDPLWANYREQALSHGLRACWSTPVFSSERKVIATFAMYYREPKRPVARDQEIVERISHLAGVAIERKRAQEALRRSEAYLAEAQRLNRSGSWALRPFSTRWHYASDEMLRIFGFDPKNGPPDHEQTIQRVHPDDRDRAARTLELEVQGQLANDAAGDLRLLMPDGTVKYAHGTVHPVFDDAGRVVEYIGTMMDVTERKHAEEALRRSETYLAEGQRISHTGSWAVRPSESKAHHCSQELLRIWGLDPQQGPPDWHTVMGRVHPDDRDRVQQSIEYLFKGNVTADGEGEYRLLLQDGTVKHVHSTVHPVFDDAQHLVEYIGTDVDVTARRRAEEALRRSEAYLAEAQKLSHTGSWAVRRGAYMPHYMSDEMYRIWGFDPQDRHGRQQPSMDQIHLDDRDRIQQLSEQMSQGSITTDVDGEYKIVLPNGSLRYVHSTLHPVFDDAGHVVEYIGTEADVTERKRAEEALRRSESYLAEAQRLSHMGSWSYDPSKQKALFWSDEMFRICGFDPQQGPPTTEVFIKRVPPEERESVLEAMRLAVQEKKEYQVEHRVILPDGAIKHIQAVGHPVLNPSGDVIEYVGSAVDVTELKRAEDERERLHQLQSELAHINRVTTMGELTASLAHEIKQPIAAAILDAGTCLSWLTRSQPDIAEASQAATRMIHDMNRASEIISRIRSLFKKGEPQRELIDVNEVIREMIVLLHGEAARYAIAIQTELSDGLPIISADRVQLQQVLMNLMLNGIEAIKERGDAGELRVTSRPSPGQQVLISVSDTGVGLPHKRADKIFDAFFTTKPQGSGMGLSISRSIIESNGGSLWAVANSERGATFQFTLPVEAKAA